VAQDDLIKALLDGAIMLDRAGGCLQVVLQRVPTPLPNEMVTVAAVVVWMDRTNAKAQPESPGLEVVAAQDTAPVQGNGLDVLEPEQADALAAMLEREDHPEPEEPEVDETDVPGHLRA
jgi:hypothetical protein